MDNNIYNVASIILSIVTLLFCLCCIYVIKRDETNNTCFSKLWLKTLIYIMIILNIINIVYQGFLMALNRDE